MSPSQWSRSTGQSCQRGGAGYRGSQAGASAATALSREKQRQYHSEGVMSAWQVFNVSIYTSLQTVLILGM